VPNVLNYVKRGIRDPSAALAYATGGRKGIGRLFLRRLLGVDKRTLDAFDRDLHSDSEFEAHLKAALQNAGRYLGEIISPEVLYFAVRTLRPSILVETGVAAGLSSAYILKGIGDNGHGLLFSIDLPNYEIELSKEGLMEEPVAVLPEGAEPGFLIPKRLKANWRLRIGKTQDLLEPLLQELDVLDFFLHDSEHSY